jgi:helicase
LEVKTDEGIDSIHPLNVLDLQERWADVAFTLDFPIPPGTSADEARRRQQATIANALWAIENRRRRDMALFGCIQALDPAGAVECARALVAAPFDGFAIGGLVPRAHDRKLVTTFVEVVRDEIGDRPLHVFGLGHPDIVRDVFAAGADSVDSSSYVKLAADGRLWADPTFRLTEPAPTDRLHLALCNLAAAAGRTLPLSASGIVFSTHALASQALGGR